MSKSTSDAYLADYLNEQTLAEKMIPTVGMMYREMGVIISVFGRKLMNSSTIDIIKAHRLGLRMVGQNLKLETTTEVLGALQKMNLGVSRIDIGKLAYNYSQLSTGESLESYLNGAVDAANHGKLSLLDKPPDVVLYGFGRIGRILARFIASASGGLNAKEQSQDIVL
mgnify:CR=1 FL=1